MNFGSSSIHLSGYHRLPQPVPEVQLLIVIHARSPSSVILVSLHCVMGVLVSSLPSHVIHCLVSLSYRRITRFPVPENSFSSSGISAEKIICGVKPFMRISD